MSNDQHIDFNSLWDYGDPVATEQHFRQLLPTIGGVDQSRHIQLLTQIARTQGLQRNFDQAHVTLDEAERMLAGDHTMARVRYLLERGRVFNSSGQPAAARPLFLAAWELAGAAGEDFYAIDAAHMLGIVEPAETGLAWNLKALDLAETTANARAQGWRGSLYNNIGWTYHDLGQYELALGIFQKAVEAREAAGQARELRIARWCVARALRSLGRVEQALAMQRGLLEAQVEGATDGYIYEELAECLLALNRPAEARPYALLAYQELSKDSWLLAQEPARVERLQRLGNAS